MNDVRPEKQYSEPDAKVKDLLAFGRELIEKNVSQDTRDSFAQLAVKPPMIRLVINLKSLISCMEKSNNYRDIMMTGLTEEERRSLVELDLRGVSSRGREIAHGLLNVHERWMMARKVGDIFHKTRTRQHEYVNLHEIFNPKDFNGGVK